MSPSRLAALSVVACFALAAAPAAHAQLGGLIKKKAAEAVKSPEKTSEKEKGSQTGEIESRLGFKLDEDVLQAFKAGLEVEIREREAFQKKVASHKTPQQYTACQTEMLQTPEGQKYTEEYGAGLLKLVDDAQGKKPEQILKDQQEFSERYAKRHEALILKYCGEDPTPLINSQPQAFERAAHAGAMEFGKVFNRGSSGEDDEAAADGVPEESCVDCAPGSTEVDQRSSAERFDAGALTPLWGALRVAADTTSDEVKKRRYGVLKEWVAFFCGLAEDKQKEAAKAGLKYGGTGTNIFWIWAKFEGALLYAACLSGEFMKLLYRLTQ